jgi:hypothetical protein
VLFGRSGERADQVDIWFNYELDAGGKLRDVDSYEGDPESIAGDAKHDWAIIKPKKPFKASYPSLSLCPSKPLTRGDFVYILQHPGGGMKKIGLIHNQVVHVTPEVVHYLTDTLPGSSGSPVCNERWEVVALHHRGVLAAGEPSAPKKNAGIPIQRVVEALVARGILGAEAGR